MAQRKQYSGEFKARVVLQALKGQHTLNEIASKYGVHPVQVAQWKRRALGELPHVFADRRAHEVRAAEEEKSRLYEQVGRLKVELEWLKKNSAVSSEKRRGWIDWQHASLSTTR
jgi:transposase-like protein